MTKNNDKRKQGYVGLYKLIGATCTACRLGSEQEKESRLSGKHLSKLEKEYKAVTWGKDQWQKVKEKLVFNITILLHRDNYSKTSFWSKWKPDRRGCFSSDVLSNWYAGRKVCRQLCKQWCLLPVTSANQNSAVLLCQSYMEKNNLVITFFVNYLIL